MKFDRRFLVMGLAFCLVIGGCGGPNSGKAVDRGHDAYSKTSAGKQAVDGGNGRSVVVKKGVDLGEYGIQLLPEAELPRDNAAYVETGLTTISTTYELVSSKPVLEVTQFYEKELGVKASISTAEDALVSGKLADGRGAAVTILRIAPKKVEVRVQILEKR